MGNTSSTPPTGSTTTPPRTHRPATAIANLQARAQGTYTNSGNLPAGSTIVPSTNSLHSNSPVIQSQPSPYTSISSDPNYRPSTLNLANTHPSNTNNATPSSLINSHSTNLLSTPQSSPPVSDDNTSHTNNTIPNSSSTGNITGAALPNINGRQRSSSTYIPSTNSSSAAAPSTSTAATTTSSARDALVASRSARTGTSARTSRQQAASIGAIHFTVSCDICGMSPIVGTRYKCDDCVDYDLCSHCFHTFNIDLNEHKSTHAMQRIERPPEHTLSSTEQFVRALLSRGVRNIRLVDPEHDPEFAERYRAFMQESFDNGMMEKRST